MRGNSAPDEDYKEPSRRNEAEQKAERAGTSIPAGKAIAKIIIKWREEMKSGVNDPENTVKSLNSIDLPSLHDIWPRINDINWSDNLFSLDKAYICSLFSSIAYLRIADFEASNANRVNVIPCYAYQKIVSSRGGFDFDTFLRGGDFSEYFVIIRRYVVIVGVRTPNVIFVSMRGTKYLYDWATNISSSKHYHNGLGGVSSFHRGFFRAIVPCFESISIELNKYLGKGPLPIYVTGHSLGGALAAIMHALWETPISREYVQEGSSPNPLRTHSCFTYGMPRYGDFSTMMRYRVPYHLYNEKDIVPTIPPRLLGFESCGSEYKADGVAIEQISRRESLRFVKWIYRLAFDRGIDDHNIEEYRKRILKVVDAKSDETARLEHF